MRCVRRARGRAAPSTAGTSEKKPDVGERGVELSYTIHRRVRFRFSCGLVDLGNTRIT